MKPTDCPGFLHLVHLSLYLECHLLLLWGICIPLTIVCSICVVPSPGTPLSMWFESYGQLGGGGVVCWRQCEPVTAVVGCGMEQVIWRNKGPRWIPHMAFSPDLGVCVFLSGWFLISRWKWCTNITVSIANV